MLGKGKSCGNKRRSVSKRRKFNIAEEVTAFPTPDERALAVKSTALAGVGVVGAEATRTGKTDKAGDLFNAVVLDNILTIDERGCAALQLRGMTTGKALNRF